MVKSDTSAGHSAVANKNVTFPNPYIPTLDGWRAIAVVLVIGAHSYTMLMNNGSSLAHKIAALFSHAGIGVDVFFCLSGYLICTLLLQEKQRTKTICMWRFYTRRAFRILPPIILFIATLVLLSTVGLLREVGAKEIFGVLFFYRNFINGSWYTGHFWSLAIEEQFYAVAPLFLLLLSRKWAVQCASVLIVLCIATRYFEYAHGMFSSSLLQFRTENRYDGLLWGMMLAFGLYGSASRAWLQQYLSGMLCMVVIVASAFLLIRFDSEPFRRTVIAAAMPILIGYTILNAQSFAGNALEFSPMRWLGRLSYSLYIWQMLFLPEGIRQLGFFQDFPLNLISPFFCAAASYYLLERPMIRFGHRLANAPGAGPSERYEGLRPNTVLQSNVEPNFTVAGDGSSDLI